MAGSQVWQNAVYSLSLHLVEQLAKLYAGHQIDGSEYAIHYAARKNRADIVRALLPYERGMQQHEEHTALMIAALQGFLDVIEVVIEAEKDTYTSTGVDALMLASSAGQLQACKVLLPIIGARDDYMMFTALHYAAANGHREICEYLLSESVYELTVIQASADIATRNGHEDIAEYLYLIADAAIKKDQPTEREVPAEEHHEAQKHHRKLFNKSLLIKIPETPKGRIRYPTPKVEAYVPDKKEASKPTGNHFLATASYTADDTSSSSENELVELRNHVAVLEKENDSLRRELAKITPLAKTSDRNTLNSAEELQIEMEKAKLISQDLLRMYKENAILRVKVLKLGGEV